MRTAAIGATCALVGGAAGIAGSSASTPHKTGGAARYSRIQAGPMIGPGFALAMSGDAAGPPVHSESIVPNEKGGFDTVTMDSGAFSSLSGERLTITEGTKSATYKTVTLTIPNNATVQRNGEKAQLSDIKSGDTVTVLESPSGTVVNADDAQHGPQIHKIRTGEGPVTGKAGEGPPPPNAPEGAGAGFSVSEGSEGKSSS